MSQQLIIHLLLIAAFLSTTAKAHTTERYQDNVSHNFQATLYGGIYLNNEQAWQIEPSIAWHFHKYIGVAMGMELTSQYYQPSRHTSIDGHEAELTESQRNVAWILIKPSIILKSPDAWRTTDRYFRLWAQAEPGLSIGCPFHNSLTYEVKEFHGAIGHTIDYRKFPNKGLKCIYWNTRVSVNFAIDRWVVSTGYGISNLDYYSGRRNVTLANNQKFHVPKKELSQSIFISLGYAF